MGVKSSKHRVNLIEDKNPSLKLTVTEVSTVGFHLTNHREILIDHIFLTTIYPMCAHSAYQQIAIYFLHKYMFILKMLGKYSSFIAGLLPP